jgi:predicted nucleic acid-binding protein
VITIGEIQKGISKLPDSRKKKQQLQKWLSIELRERFRDRILDITIGTAYVWGQVLGACEKKGIILPAIDSLIASQGIFNEMTIVTRNVVDMEPSGAPLFNPWET